MIIFNSYPTEIKVTLRDLYYFLSGLVIHIGRLIFVI
jgi:hypothetical protein